MRELHGTLLVRFRAVRCTAEGRDFAKIENRADSSGNKADAGDFSAVTLQTQTLTTELIRRGPYRLKALGSKHVGIRDPRERFEGCPPLISVEDASATSSPFNLVATYVNTHGTGE